ncbi:hypothetical protein [Massilia horti]|uniref:Uncharacterized protein n=1 Tax=Massilia horti TaxID=2562153 RepID=A0A4Y9T4G8_9BURK|nr:hypothetical protein [Massilia horti]TFW35551.1 hypothetical protein E4O92_01795 [Massilia horti]
MNELIDRVVASLAAMPVRPALFRHFGGDRNGVVTGAAVVRRRRHAVRALGAIQLNTACGRFGLPLSADVPARARGAIAARDPLVTTVDAGAVLANIGSRERIGVDARG